MRKEKRREFKYQSRSKEDVKKRAEQKSGSFDKPYKENFEVFVPKAGDHRIRILPPTWDNPEHYGIDAWFHSSIGPDNQTYLCPAKMGEGPCPVCDTIKSLKTDTDNDRVNKENEDIIKAIKPYKRVLMWVIDRNEESLGPCLYGMPWTMDQNISVMSIDKDSGGILEIDHHEQGFDIEFTKEGTGLNTKYNGIMIARRESPISSDSRQMDSWLEFIEDNPLPSILNFYSYDHIMSALDGGPAPKASVSPTAARLSRNKVEDEDGDDEEVEATEPVVERRRSRVKVEEIIDEPDEDDDDDEETEEIEEDDEPVATSTMSTREKVVESLRRSRK